ncbi:tRNA (N(6)-L-threonylcarbamoyladenosine(37)-C(2))-methylthiotransferase MtaB [Alkalibacter mobilis]|uniref:tRNA (N(6)-L-threonylcarbamoyladenosine(37)-C(2))- methylthiotransferase MtaB n=1 Tax=Alkalibacter mobilis TaxID=2787712 RepID=UPI00189D75C8|nr:tRNA (N(6)-L-threonylcarbamoyladenosine(37)-C(2))-methylthiotransferase MtaB [Alkalibacter mobilis]MBF7096862.1 tRNA (N(6)-L-threonylcarbamoyladenosine(37)-C(2))-methylthiotransferase MtaB [Alkalibacter mobilis]
MKKAAIHTLGCKVNTYDSEAIMELLESEGYQIIDFHDKADVYIINTCTVTNLGDKKSRQMIRRAKKNNPEAFIIVCGCYAQTASEKLEEMPEIDLIIGNNDRHKIISYIEEAVSKGLRINAVKDIMKIREYEELEINHIHGRERGFIKIQEGCDQFCTYCIIPYARGPVRSRRPENIISEAKRMIANGNTELVLTGINISKYGKDLGNINLMGLLEKLDTLEDLHRIRISSLEPTVLTEEFVEQLTSIGKLCDHFHISLQSGSQKTLKDMKRKYDKDEYMKVIENIRKFYPDASITTDIMVGFPGETQEDFEETLQFVKKIGFSDMHVFKYSRREGTPAAEYENQVDETVKDQRSATLMELAKQMKADYEKQYLGNVVEVLFEHEVSDATNTFQGHTKNYLTVQACSDANIESRILKVELCRINNGVLFGKIVN